MKKFEISEEKLKELLTFLGNVPFNFANPVIQFLQKELVEIKQETTKPELKEVE